MGDPPIEIPGSSEIQQREDMPVCTVDDVGIKITAKVPDAQAEADQTIAELNDYFRHFAKPIQSEGDGLVFGKTKCLNCDANLAGFLGSFEFGLAHGEGICSRCGWPCRAKHYPKDSDGDEIFDRALEIILQYHPKEVTRA